MKTIIEIKGTHCHSCKLLIEDVCNDLKGIQSCTVDFKTGKTVIEHDQPIDIHHLKTEIESLGKYKVKVQTD